jgi:hypothetical protein
MCNDDDDDDDDICVTIHEKSQVRIFWSFNQLWLLYFNIRVKKMKESDDSILLSLLLSKVPNNNDCIHNYVTVLKAVYVH